jgi:hypothetical protein
MIKFLDKLKYLLIFRDPFTLLTLPGVLCGEMGAKAGLNGLVSRKEKFIKN